MKMPKLDIESLKAMLSGGISTATAFVFAMGDDHVVVTHVVAGKVADAWVTGPKPDDLNDDVFDALSRDKKTPVVVLIDSLEQLFREETVPAVSFLDQGKVVSRYLGMAFTGQGMRGAIFLEKGEGKTRKYLFASVPQSRVLDKWMDVFQKLPNPLAGVHMLPLESMSMLENLNPYEDQHAEGAGNRWRVLIGHNLTGGFRQIIEKNDRLALARLTQAPPPETPPAEVAAMLEKDFKANLSYIKRLGFQVGETLYLTVLTTGATRDALAHLDWGVTKAEILSPHEAAERLGLGSVGAVDSGYCDVLHAVWMASQKVKKLNIWGKAQDTDYVQMAERFSPFIAGLFSLGVLYYIGDAALTGYELYDGIARYDERLVTANDRLARAKEKLAGLPYTPAQVRNAMALSDETHKDLVPFDPVFEALAANLGEGARVTALSFEVPDDKSAAQPARGRQAAAPQASGGPRPHEVVLTLAFPLAVATPEEAIEFGDAVLARLKKAFPTHVVVISKPPVDVLPNQVLRGSTQRGGLSSVKHFSAEFTVSRKAS
ncbi:MAG: hypothetical protein HQL38_09500 [Alphaproteobacteria bacterium]|nr:hypothetical protein [Alphaproteobacteria bacterium]